MGRGKGGGGARKGEGQGRGGVREVIMPYRYTVLAKPHGSVWPLQLHLPQPTKWPPVVTYLAIPDVRLQRCLQHKAVVGVEGRSLLLYLHSTGVQGGGPLDLEETSAVYVVRVTVKAVLES